MENVNSKGGDKKEVIQENFLPSKKRGLKESAKYYGKIGMWALGLFLIGAIATALATDGGPIEITSQAQTIYDSAKHTYCQAEKGLAQAKVMDYANSFIELNEDDLIRLHAKRDQDCAFIMEAGKPQ